MTRTLAADRCPDWDWLGDGYAHHGCPEHQHSRDGIRFEPPEHRAAPGRPVTAVCTACGARWHRTPEPTDALSLWKAETP